MCVTPAPPYLSARPARPALPLPWAPTRTGLRRRFPFKPLSRDGRHAPEPGSASPPPPRAAPAPCEPGRQEAVGRRGGAPPPPKRTPNPPCAACNCAFSLKQSPHCWYLKILLRCRHWGLNENKMKKKKKRDAQLKIAHVSERVSLVKFQKKA